MSETNDTIQSLSRIIEAAVRLMAMTHRMGILADPNDEVGYMRANLDRVAREVSR